MGASGGTDGIGVAKGDSACWELNWGCHCMYAPQNPQEALLGVLGLPGPPLADTDDDTLHMCDGDCSGAPSLPGKPQRPSRASGCCCVCILRTACAGDHSGSSGAKKCSSVMSRQLRRRQCDDAINCMYSTFYSTLVHYIGTFIGVCFVQILR